MIVSRFSNIYLKPHLHRVLPEKKAVVLWVLLGGFGALLLLSGQSVQAAGIRLDGVTIDDLAVIDQEGQSLKFKSEILKDRIAVVIPFYTTCTTAYPILVFTFTRLQEMLAEQLGRDVVLISVSVEPKIDTPGRMKAYAKRQKAKAGWMFLSGEKKDLEKILYGIGILPSENLVEHDHNPITIIGGAQTEWLRFHGFPSPELLKTEISQLLGKK